jgi:hypothetical protein
MLANLGLNANYTGGSGNAVDPRDIGIAAANAVFEYSKVGGAASEYAG